MKHQKLFTGKSFFFVFFLCSTLPCSKSILTEEIIEILNENLSDGNLAYSQVQYIINELNLEPNCIEISRLFRILRISNPRIENLIQLHCKKPEKAGIHQKKPEKTRKKVKLNASVQEKIRPREGNKSPYLAKFKAQYNQSAIKYRKNSGPGLSSFRSLKISNTSLSVESGDLYLRKGLSFVNGRNFWPDQSSRSENQGLLFSRASRYNGIQFSLQKKNFAMNSYTSWNKNHHGDEMIDAVMLGSTAKYNFQEASLVTHTQLSSLDRATGPDEKFLINGIGLQGPEKNKYSLGAGHSFHQPPLWVADAKPKTGYYAEAGYRFRAQKTGVQVFQASADWANPFMDIHKKYAETTEQGTPIRGGGEGGIDFNSRIPFSSRQSGSSLHLNSRVHWFTKKSEMKYRQHTMSLVSRLKSFKPVLKFRMTRTDSTDFLSLEPALKFKYHRLEPGLLYSHKFGDYRGQYTRSLSLRTHFFNGKGFRTTFKLKWKDIVERKKDIYISFFQGWKLSNGLKFENVLYLPLENSGITNELYYKIMLRWGLKL